MKKRIITCVSIAFVIVSIISSLNAFNWPVEDFGAKNMQSYFGQLRGKLISPSFIFENPDDVKAIGDGKLLIYMKDDVNDTSMFPSTLGNCVLISHKDDLVSVYGNLDEPTMEKNLDSKTNFSQDEKIGSTGTSGFQVRVSNLEFQIFDSKNGSAINPKIFMPRTNNEIPLVLSNITLQNKNGSLFNLSEVKNLVSGTYRIYQGRNSVACPYKSKVTINGVVVDELTFDTINEENSRIYINGKKQYLSNVIYPNSELQLLGEAVLTPGHSTLGIEVADYLGNKKNISFALIIN